VGKEQQCTRLVCSHDIIEHEWICIEYDRKELIKIFDEANNMLRGDGLRAGIERFGEFANILFLKLVSENEQIKNDSGIRTSFDNACHWNTIKNIPKSGRVDYINNVYCRLNQLYQTEIFTPLTIRSADILKEIMDKLDPLTLTDVDSDVKGDAFEYFLKESTAAKNDLGEYFTPRHIVKTMVKLVNPQIGEKIYDPFCGTGGFLIESFRHIWNTMPRNDTNKRRLREETIYGNEITNTARITKMNMILAGDGHSNIHMQDSLANPIDGVKGYGYDIVITNIPYSQKTKYDNFYDLPSNNGDSICVQHCMKAINSTSENGRMALVVPEGFLFRKALSKTRELLLKNCNLQSIISLPQGVFLPYTGVKTNIIYATKANQNLKNSQKRKDFWYFDVKSDGYTLDNHRRKLDEGSDLDKYQEYRKLDDDQRQDMLNVGFEAILLEKVKENAFILTGSRYRNSLKLDTTYHTHTLNEIIDINFGIRITQQKNTGNKYPVFGGGGVSFYTDEYIREDEYVISRFGVSANCVRYVKGKFYLLDSGFTFSIKKEYLSSIDKDFVGKMLLGYQDVIFKCSRGQAQKNMDMDLFKSLVIPIPPLTIQLQIVQELDGYQRIVESSEQLIDVFTKKMQNKINEIWNE
jgi:type I restriction enzyme M protein